MSIVRNALIAATLSAACARPDPETAPAIDLNLLADEADRSSFLRGVRPGAIVGEGRVVHRTRQVAFLEGRLLDEAGETVATGSSTVRIKRLPPEAFASRASA